MRRHLAARSDTSPRLSAGAGGAGDVEVVAVAAAGDAVAAGWSSASSSSLMDASWTRGSAAEYQCARRRCDSLTFNALSNLYSTP